MMLEALPLPMRVDKIAAMCHHYISARNPPPHLADEFSVRSNLYQIELPLGGFYPLAQVPAVRVADDDQREAVALEWGLLPRWWKPSDKSGSRKAYQRKCFNARSESVDTKPTYRDAFRQRRCLLPATEFMEKGHYFHLADKRPFAFAGLWERWEREGEVVESCTLLTTEPNELVRGVGHHRMPVLLTTVEDYARWLDPDLVERGALEELFRPTDPRVMECYAASKP